MTKLNDLLVAAQGDLPITMRHERWLANNANVAYPTQHLERAFEELAGGDRDRRQSFSASSAGDCQRRQIFSFIGVTSKKVESETANIFHTGNFIHLKWQLAGLTEGWLVEIEVPLISEEFPLRGTMDGLVWDGSGFEFKTINDNGYRNVSMFGPKKEHINQVHAYMYLADLDAFSIVYENKNNGEWREFRVKRDEEKINELKAGWAQLTNYLDVDDLPDVLEECKQKEGKYRYCPYKDSCLKIRGMKDARSKVRPSKARPVQSEA
jgi:hypothetical protein